MRLRHALRGTVHDWLADTRVDSRWWYWIAAIPAAFALWTLAVSWVTVALILGPLDATAPVPRAIEVSLVVFTVPFLVLVAMAPLAVLADVAAIRDAGLTWPHGPLRAVAPALLAPAVLAAGLAADLATDGALDAPHWAVLAGFIVAIPAAAVYLARRHDRVGVP